MSIYTSELAARALRLDPIGSPWSGGEECCGQCGRPLQSGMPSVPMALTDTFTSFRGLVPSNHVCGWCKVTSQQHVMRYLQNTLVTQDACYSIAKDSERAWLFLTPPEPPFAVVIQQTSPTSTFHLHWRTPVTIDKNLIHLRYEERILMIRRPVLLDAIQWCETIARALEMVEPPKGKLKKKSASRRHHPYLWLDRKMSNPNHGAILPEALELAGHQDLVKRLQNLWAGELWALAALAKADTPTPTAPVAVTSVKPITGSH